VNFGYDLLKIATSEDDYRKMEIAIDLNEKSLAEKVENLLDFSNSMRHKYLSMTSLLRAELKSYE